MLADDELGQQFEVLYTGAGTAPGENDGACRDPARKGAGEQMGAVEHAGLDHHFRQQSHAEPAFHHLQQRVKAGGLQAALAPGHPGGAAGFDCVVAQTVTLFEEQDALRVDFAYRDFLQPRQRIVLVRHEPELVPEKLPDHKISGPVGQRDQREIQIAGVQLLDQPAGQVLPQIELERAVRAALSGALDGACTVAHPVFGVAMPTAIEGVPSDVLDPRKTWNDGAAYDAQAKKLASMFAENIKKFSGLDAAVLAAGPKA